MSIYVCKFERPLYDRPPAREYPCVFIFTLLFLCSLNIYIQAIVVVRLKTGLLTLNQSTWIVLSEWATKPLCSFCVQLYTKYTNCDVKYWYRLNDGHAKAQHAVNKLCGVQNLDLNEGRFRSKHHFVWFKSVDRLYSDKKSWNRLKVSSKFLSNSTQK